MWVRVCGSGYGVVSSGLVVTRLVGFGTWFVWLFDFGWFGGFLVDFSVWVV